MMTTGFQSPIDPKKAFVHEALFYAGEADFVDRAASFIRDGMNADEAVLVMVNPAKIDLLRSVLDGEADPVQFADMAEVGRNPARIIPIWREFVERHARDGRRFRGIGEPIWAERSPEELVECERHESLVNLAFAGPPAWWLICPYDTEALEPSVLAEAARNHPLVLELDILRESTSFRDLDAVATPFDLPLPEPPGRPVVTTIRAGHLDAARRFVARHAGAQGLDRARTDDLVFAVNELATNSLLYAGGRRVLRMWPTHQEVVCEVRDDGQIDDPLVGRASPSPDWEGGFGLWLVNQLCDLVQIRSFETGSVVRLHMSAH
jgi:anti-sigma regulatory factor (Ser/Thr protein kinase)